MFIFIRLLTVLAVRVEVFLLLHYKLIRAVWYFFTFFLSDPLTDIFCFVFNLPVFPFSGTTLLLFLSMCVSACVCMLSRVWLGWWLAVRRVWAEPPWSVWCRTERPLWSWTCPPLMDQLWQPVWETAVPSLLQTWVQNSPDTIDLDTFTHTITCLFPSEKMIRVSLYRGLTHEQYTLFIRLLPREPFELLKRQNINYVTL